MQVVSTKFAKKLVCHVVMSQTVYCVSRNNDHHLYATAQYWNLVGGIQSNSRPGITRPLHATGCEQYREFALINQRQSSNLSFPTLGAEQ